MADLYDGLTLNTRATGNWGGKPPKLPEWPRPEKRTDKKRVTVKDLWQRLQGRR